MHPDLKITKLTKPVAINVANEDAVLQGIALQDVPITWGLGKSSIHTMLVVPKLAWHILFGNNHLEASDAIVKHKERIVSFTHPQMQFAIKCPREPPVRPSGRVETSVVSLSTVVETPQKLLPGINVIQTCLTLATITSVLLSLVLSTMLADTIQSFGNQCWIESSPFLTSTHLHVIPGPLNLDQIHHETTAFRPPYLSTAPKTELESLIRKYAHVFMLPGAPFRGVTIVEHSIETGDAKPQYTTPYSHSPAQLNLIKQEIHKMLEQNILKPSTSPWGAPYLLVKRKTEHGRQVAPRLFGTTVN